LVLTCSGDLHIKIWKTRAHNLQNSETLRVVFQQPPMVAYRRGKNLMDILVHRKTNRVVNKPDKNRGMWKCGRKRCAVCKFVKETEALRTPDRKVVRVSQEITCQTSNIIYMRQAASVVTR